MNYRDDNEYKGMPEQQVWLIKFLGYYAEHKLTDKYEDTLTETISSACLCQDGRRIPTVRRYLEDLKLVIRSYNTNKNLIPIDAEVEKLLSGYTVEPTFIVSGRKPKTEYSFSSDAEEIIKSKGELYRGISDLNARELIYVYLHQDEYDFSKFSDTYYHGNGRHGPTRHTSHSTRIYPKKLLEQADDSIISTHNNEFATKHARAILTHLLKMRFRAIKDDAPYTRRANVVARITNVTDKIRLLERTLRELRVLERHIAEVGDETFNKSVMDASMDYIMRHAPLWAGSEDDDEQYLAKLFLKGETEVITERTHYR